MAERSADADATMPDAPDWAVVAARAADDKQAIDVVVLDVGEVLAITGQFVIASAGNTRLVRSIAEDVEAVVAAAGGPRPRRTEGLDDLRWVLLDYGDFVVHVFLDEARHYYELERLWSDVPRIEWRPDEVPAEPSAG
ncbi:MAG TPA: ribosome silencing factor [Acidimicrobiales bacterium]